MRCSRNTFFFLTGVAAIGIGLLIRALKTGPVCDSTTDLSGKTVLITGGNTGIGKETAIGLARRNARVIIACRNAERARQAVEEIVDAGENEKVEFALLDLADFSDIRRFAKDFMEHEDKLDILINNAATVNVGKTKDGFELMFGVNQLGPFLLTNLLLPLMRKTSKKNAVRIINVSSEAYKFGKIDFDNLSPSSNDSTTMIESMMLYGSSKLMNIHFTNELQRRLKEEFKGQHQAITTYSLHPGTIQSDLGKGLAEDRGVLSQVFRYIWMSMVAKPTFYGTQTTLCCALEEGIEKLSGLYFKNLKPTELWPIATDPEVGEKLWEICEKLTAPSS